MKSSRAGMLPAVSWIGLLWVYSGVFWIALLLRAGTPGSGGVIALRLALTLALGIGLCALDRWAWAGAVCLTSIYTLVCGAAAGAAGWTLLSLPAGTLSWKPVLWGLNAAACGRIAGASAAVALLSGGLCLALLRAAPEFDVPAGRVFSVLNGRGFWMALAILALDGFLLLQGYGMMHE